MLHRLTRAAPMALACLMLAGCAHGGLAPPGATAALPGDATVAAVSAKVARACTVTRTALALAAPFVGNHPRVALAVEAGRVAVADYCDQPPTDTRMAFQALATIATDVVAAVAAARKEI